MTAKQQREQREADWRWLVGHDQGRRILADLIHRSGLMHPSFNLNPLVTARAEGRRSLGGEIYARFTEAAQGAERPALLAEVLCPDVRNRRSDRDRADDPDGEG